MGGSRAYIAVILEPNDIKIVIHSGQDPRVVTSWAQIAYKAVIFLDSGLCNCGCGVQIPSKLAKKLNTLMKLKYS